MSINPGATTCPCASMVRARRELVRLPIAAILPLRMPMSPEYQGEPVPSMIRPRVMTMSKGGDCAMERGRATNERRSARKTGSRGIAQSPPFDIVITRGRIIDGTGSPWYSGDIGIRSGRIAAIGNLTSSRRARTIDAHGQVVAPGFIDMLGQSELTILVDPRLPSKIHQGITTEITGEGESVAPMNDAIRRSGKRQFDLLGIQADWQTFREYFARLEKQGIGINVADYVGATTVRRMALGDDDVQPTSAQLEQM